MDIYLKLPRGTQANEFLKNALLSRSKLSQNVFLFNKYQTLLETFSANRFL